jgi:phosphocarrier protein
VSEGSEAVVSRTVTIVNRRGLHARAAAKLVNAAERFSANVDVLRDGQSVSARSIMGLMMLGAGMGSAVELRAEGFDAHEALEAIAALIEAGFHESD